MVGEQESRRLLWEAAGEADLILIEGVMGLFDGTPSSADLARHFGVPVLGVIDGTAMAQTFGALAWVLHAISRTCRLPVCWPIGSAPCAMRSCSKAA